jgi:hypothetical protein
MGQTKLTVTELVRRLNQLPPEVSQKGEVCEVTEAETEVTIVIPASVFAGDDPRSLLAEQGGIHGILKGAE